MRCCAASTGIPRPDQRIGDAQAAADDRPSQGRRYPRVASPARSPTTATARQGSQGPVGPGRPCHSGCPAAPTPPPRAAPDPAPGTPRDRAALAPRSDRRPSRPDLTAQAHPPATHRAVDPAASAAPGPGEQLVRGDRHIHEELLVLDITVAASTVSEILHDAGIDLAPSGAGPPGR